MLSPSAKRYCELPDGRPAYQRHKYLEAIKHVPHKKVFIDIGGHCGLWGMQAELEFDQIIAFEPCDEHADIYPHNMRGDSWELHRVALGDKECEVGLALYPESTGSTHVDKAGTGVPMRTLDSFELDRADLIKIDVEGFELPVLKGAVDTIHRCRPVIVLEQKGRESDHFGGTRREGLAFLERLGMRQLRPPMSGDYVLGW